MAGASQQARCPPPELLAFLLLASLVTACSKGSADAPARATAGFTFTAAGDFGTSADANATLAVMGQAGARLHLALGDLSYAGPGSEPAWCAQVRSWIAAPQSVLLVPGNHEDDVGADGHIRHFAACLPDGLGVTGSYPSQYFVDVEGLARFILIAPDLTVEGTHYYYGHDTEPSRWLAAAIDGARTAGIPWVIVGMHKNCLSVGVYYCQVYQDLLSLLVAKHVDLVLHAHDHTYQRSHQLALTPTCPAVLVDRFDPACVADGGEDGAYVKGAGSVFVVVGSAGADLYEVNPADREAGYFATWMGANAHPRKGMLKVSVTRDSLSAEFVGSTQTSAYADRFVIGEPP